MLDQRANEKETAAEPSVLADLPSSTAETPDGPISDRRKAQHPWLKAYFQGPRARAAAGV